METIAVIFGGQSTEHDVSIVTAIVAIINPLKASQKYRVEPIYIAKDGSWYSDPKLADIKLYSSGKIDDFLSKLRPLKLNFNGSFTITKTVGIAKKTKDTKIDVAYTALHGTKGEDGSLMGLLNMSGVPYVGCGIEASVLAMNKVLSKEVAQNNNISTPKFVSFTKRQYQEDEKNILAQINKLNYPVFVKPSHLGSSIGITKVNTKKELTNAIEVALHHDNLALVEEGVENLIEVTLPILGTTEEPQLASVEQSQLNSDGVFDFDAKYIGQGGKGGGKGGAKSGSEGFSAEGYSKIPAEISPKLMAECQEMGRKVWKSLGLYGIARVDMLINSKTNQLYFNEVNPLPGSLYMHNWVASGFSPVEVNTRLIELAKQRFQQESEITRTFSTNFLKQF